MSIIPMPEWVNRKRQPKLLRPFDSRPGAVNFGGPNFQIPEDMMAELDRALLEERQGVPLGTPAPRVRTAQDIAAEIEHLDHELANARELVAKGEAKRAELGAELKTRIDEEVAAKKATHEAELAELESLRASTGEVP